MKHGLLAMTALASVAALGLVDGGAPAEARPRTRPGVVKLLDAGAAPRAVLRYQVPKDTRATYDLVMKLDMSTGTMVLPQLPTLTMTMEQTCTAVERGGAMRFEARLASLRIDGGGAQQPIIDAMRTMMEGMVQRYRVSPTGAVDAVEVTGLKGEVGDLPQQLRDNITQFSAPLPAKAVGPGATWRFERTGKASGMTMSTVADYELVGVTDGVASLTAKGVLDAPKQKVTKNGFTVALDSLDGELRSTLAVDLRRFVPRGTVNVSIDMLMTMGDQKVPMHMAMELTVTPR